MRLVGAELLKMRRRMMTYILLITLIVVMALVFLLIATLAIPVLREGIVADSSSAPVPFYFVYAIAGDFVFGLGSLLVIIYTGAIVGGDYTWGVLRNAFSRGESRVNYALAKAGALAIGVAIGAAIALILGELMILLGAADARVDLGSPFSADALTDLVKAYGLGMLVLLERGAIGFAVAVLLRSQVAGIVVGVVLYIAEPIVASLASALSQVSNFDVQPAAPSVHWSQFLPFTIGSSVLSEAHASLNSLAEGSGLSTTATVPLAQSVPVLLLYGVIALAIACFAIRRQEIIG